MFVISSSQLGAKEKHVRNAIKLMRGDDVHHYWDGERHIGRAAQEFIEGLNEPAWDLWLLYKPGRTWDADTPEPDWWEHQLGALRRKFPERWLDAERFAGKATKLAAP